MSWLGKWFTDKPSITDAEFYAVKKQVNRFEVELCQLRESISQAFMDNELAHKAIRSKLNEQASPIDNDLKPKAPNINDPYPYSPYRYGNGTDLSTAMVVTASMVDLTDTYTEVSSSSYDSPSSSSYDSSSSSSGD